MENRDVAALLEEWADILAAEGRGHYRVRAYRRAASAVRSWPTSVEAEADPTRIPGVGETIAGQIRQIVAGDWPQLQRARASVSGAVAAQQRALLGAIRGDLHAHTTATDGRDSIEDMVRAAQARGYRYIAITDHSETTRIAGGLDEERMRRHLAAVRRVGDAVDGIDVLAGAEVDIRRDGTLDYSNGLLGDMDVVGCSVHFRYNMDGHQQTARILSAMSNEHADILCHPTARRMPRRPGMDIDMAAIIDAAAAQGWAIEMNGSPERLDLDGPTAKHAADRGVRLSLASDAHATHELGNVRNACLEAAKAGIGPGSILNAGPVEAVARR